MIILLPIIVILFCGSISCTYLICFVSVMFHSLKLAIFYFLTCSINITPIPVLNFIGSINQLKYFTITYQCRIRVENCCFLPSEKGCLQSLKILETRAHQGKEVNIYFTLSAHYNHERNALILM